MALVVVLAAVASAVVALLVVGLLVVALPLDGLLARRGAGLVALPHRIVPLRLAAGLPWPAGARVVTLVAVIRPGVSARSPAPTTTVPTTTVPTTTVPTTTVRIAAAVHRAVPAWRGVTRSPGALPVRRPASRAASSSTAAAAASTVCRLARES